MAYNSVASAIAPYHDAAAAGAAQQLDAVLASAAVLGIDGSDPSEPPEPDSAPLKVRAVGLGVPRWAGPRGVACES